MWISRQRAIDLAHRILHTGDTPERTSAAFALGVGLGMSPFFGFHTLIALILAFAFRLNRVAVIAGAWLNTPYTIVPLATFGTVLGSVMTGNGWIEVPWPARADFVSVSALRLYMGELRPIGLYFLIGNLTLSLIFGTACYFLSLPIVRRLRHHHELKVAQQHAQRDAQHEQHPKPEGRSAEPAA